MVGKAVVIVFILSLFLGMISPGVARDAAERQLPIGYRIKPPAGASDRPLDMRRGPSPSASTTLDTFVLAEFSFDTWPDYTQGWTSRDITAQLDTFFHVADSTELDGGTFGNLVVLEGSRSLWCGAAPGSHPEMCSWGTLPGYGNSWTQLFVSIPFARTGDVNLSYKIWWDVESYEDRVYVQYLDKDDVWTAPLVQPPFKDYYDGDGFRVEQITFPGSSLGDSIRVRFWVRTDGAWSDEDGLWPTDGAVIIDSLLLSDASGPLDFQDFELEPAGAHATSDGHWQASYGEEPYGDLSDLFPGSNVVQEDMCARNMSNAWGFFAGSTDDYACGGYPEQAAVPFGREVENAWQLPWVVYIQNEVWSPFIDWTHDMNGTPVPASASSARLEFDVYRDLPLDNLVFYYWVVRSVTGGCGERFWDNNRLLYYSPNGEKSWFLHREEIANYIDPAAEQVQIALGVMDGCGIWCGTVGSGDCHGHAPLFDNVRLVRVATSGPSWPVWSGGLFQDNFAADGTTTGTVRMDRGYYGGAVLDSACVTVFSPLGIDNHVTGDPQSGSAVYCHVKDISGAKSGDAVSGDVAVWPVVDAGGGWTVLQCSKPSSHNSYCLDLNDNLFTPGDTVEYYFSARDVNGNENYWSVLAGATPSEADARAWPNEATCLPANALAGRTDILYVDDFDGLGAQPFFASAFEQLGLEPDRYDVLAPSTSIGSGPGAHVVDVIQQIVANYRIIVWNSGSLSDGLIGDNPGAPAYSDDFAMLFTFLDQSPDGPGLYISGDNVAQEWVTLAGSGAVSLRGTYMNFNLTHGDHAAAGAPLWPLVVGEPGSCFDHPGAGVDTLIAYGGCPSIRNFDVLAPTGSAGLGMSYSGNPAHGAVVNQATVNSVGDTARVLLSGFSFHQIRDDRAHAPIDRVEHLNDVLRWLGGAGGTVTGTETAPSVANSLSQNYPNPFNPVTTIRYRIKTRGHVSLRVYDVAGRLVRTLVDEVQGVTPEGFAVEWGGVNNRGDRVASGVYYYRLVTGDFVRARRMVLLK